MQYSGYTINRSDRIFVTGHINPDTDSIAAAIGYAWLLRERDNLPTVACRAGSVNLQTAWVLKTLNLEQPILLTDASPRFESVTKRYDVATPDKSLNEAWAILTRTGGIAPIVNADGTPYGMVTGKSVFDFFATYYRATSKISRYDHIRTTGYSKPGSSKHRYPSFSTTNAYQRRYKPSFTSRIY